MRYATCFQQCLILVFQTGNPTLKVGAFGTTEQLAHILVGRVYMPFLHLYPAHLTGQTHYAYIVSRRSFHCNNIAFGHIKSVRQTEKIFSVILESYLYAIKRLDARLAYAAHPVARSHLAATAGLYLAYRHIRLRTSLATARQEHTFVILHPRQRRVRLKVGVYRIFRSYMLSEYVYLFILVILFLFFLLSLAAVAYKGLHLFGGGGIVVHLRLNGTRCFYSVCFF